MGNGGAPQTNAVVPAAASRQRLSELQPISGGAFSATYSGRYHERGECSIGRENAHIRMHGAGYASFLYESKEKERLKGSGDGLGPCGWSGHATLTSSTSSDDSIVMQVTELPSWYGCDCTFQASGGTGKFVDATGSGTVTLQVSGNKYSEEWSGTLYY
jgi:hypothetical protein